MTMHPDTIIRAGAGQLRPGYTPCMACSTGDSEPHTDLVVPVSTVPAANELVEIFEKHGSNATFNTYYEDDYRARIRIGACINHTSVLSLLLMVFARPTANAADLDAMIEAIIARSPQVPASHTGLVYAYAAPGLNNDSTVDWIRNKTIIGIAFNEYIDFAIGEAVLVSVGDPKDSEVVTARISSANASINSDLDGREEFDQKWLVELALNFPLDFKIMGNLTVTRSDSTIGYGPAQRSLIDA